MASPSRTSSFLSGVWKTFGRFVKPPWMITGPVSSPDFKLSESVALTYRIVSPASQTERAIIPHAHTSNIYDIKYFNRDNRRHELKHAVEAFKPLAPAQSISGVIDKATLKGVEVQEKPAAAETEGSTEQVQEEPKVSGPAPKYYTMGSFYHINDTPGGGYT